MWKRWAAIAAAVLVTFLWSTSYILNQLAFREGIGPFTLAGLRYAVAVAALFAVRALERRKEPGERASLSVSEYVLLGITGYLMAQGLQYAGQALVNPTQTTLTIALGNTALVLILGAAWLREIPSPLAWAGIIGALGGVTLYYYPFRLGQSSLPGMALILLSSVGYAVNLMANRRLLLEGKAHPRDLILYPMLIGAVGMLLIGTLREGLPHISLRLAVILLWLGTVNGALAFSLWVWSQKTLRAFESSILNNLVLLQVAGLDVLVLGRSLSGVQAGALLLTGIAVAFVQVAPRRRAAAQ